MRVYNLAYNPLYRTGHMSLSKCKSDGKMYSFCIPWGKNGMAWCQKHTIVSAIGGKYIELKSWLVVYASIGLNWFQNPTLGSAMFFFWFKTQGSREKSRHTKVWPLSLTDSQITDTQRRLFSKILTFT